MRTFLSAATVVAVALLATACSMEVSDDPTTAGNTQEVTVTESATNTTSDDADEDATTETTDETDDAAADEAPNEDRAAYESLITDSHDCAGGAVTVDSPGAVVEITADCASVTVDATGAVILAEAIDSLTITGTGNIVFTTELGAVNVDSTGNVVTYDSGNPTVSDTGTGNVISKS